MHSHHSHSGAFCAHAQSGTTPWSMVEKAHAIGFTRYNLSEHIPRNKASYLYPEEIEAGIDVAGLADTFDRYLVEARKVAEYWQVASKDPSEPEKQTQGSMQILVGSEIENLDGRTSDFLDFQESILRDSKGQWRVDYVVGSVHHVCEIPIDFDKPTYERALQHMHKQIDSSATERNDGLPLEGIARRLAHFALMEAYLEAQYALLQRFKPEVIGHYDLCRLYEPDVPMTWSESAQKELPKELHAPLKRLDALLRRNTNFAVGYGALFEVNSASVRKGWSTPYPGKGVLELVMELQGRLCLSDDAHSHEQVGLNYQIALDYLKRQGVDTIWFLERKVGGSSDSSTGSFLRGTQAKSMPLAQLKQLIYPAT